MHLLPRPLSVVSISHIVALRMWFPSLNSLSPFFSPFLSSFLYHLPDREPWKPWAVLQLSYVLVHHLWAVPHNHWWPCKLWCGLALYVQRGVLCLCHHCHSPHAELVNCHDGWYPLESGPWAGWALESPGNLLYVVRVLLADSAITCSAICALKDIL